MARSFVSGDYVQVPNDATLNVSVGAVAFWFKTSGGGNMGLWARADANSRNGGTVFIAASNGTIASNLYNGSSATGFGAGTKVVTDNKWHQFTWSFNQANGGTENVYIDGVLDSTANNSVAWNWNSQAVRLGRVADGFWSGFVGSMCESAMWNANLTADEASGLAGGALPKDVRPGSLLYYVPMWA